MDFMGPKWLRNSLALWVSQQGMLETLLTDNGPQFMAKFFESLDGLLEIHHFPTTV